MNPRTSILVPILALAGVSSDLRAAVLTVVPMQGGMVMPMIAYHADEGHLRVMLDPAIPALTPLLASHPSDGFAPSDPWYDALDPTRQGLAFSRRYGFVMDTMTDPLPAGQSIWLRKLSGPPELGAYRYANSSPKAFEPIFGTSGTPTAMAWNGMMFHPTFTAPPGTHEYTAVFDAYLSDSTAGTEIPHSSTGPFELRWTSLPDGRPGLAIARKIAVSWTVPSGTYLLETADSPTSPHWTVVPTPPVNIDGKPTVLLDPSDVARVYRLRQTQ